MTKTLLSIVSFTRNLKFRADLEHNLCKKTTESNDEQQSSHPNPCERIQINISFELPEQKSLSFSRKH